MAYYIIIRGALGVGKSAIARKLAQHLDAEHVSIDSVLKKHNLDNVEGECIPAKNFIKADEIVLPKIKEKLEKGKIIIFDGCFYHKEQIEHLISNLQSKHYIFTLKAPLEVCIKRDSGRKRIYGKDAARVVHNLVSKFDYGTVIDSTNKSEDEAIKEILSYLP